MKITKEVQELVDRALEQIGLQEYSHQVYEVLNKLNARGYGAQTAVAVAIYVVCKNNAIPIAISKICNVTNTSKKGIFNLLKKHGLIGVSVTPEKYVSKIIEQLGLDKNVEQSAIEFLKQMSNNCAHHPITKAVTAVYLACKKHRVKITQRKLQELFGVSEAVIRYLLSKPELQFL